MRFPIALKLGSARTSLCEPQLRERLIVLRVEAGLAISTIGAVPEGVAGLRLPVVFSSQAQSFWCWAACCEMIFRFLDTNQLEQCDLAAAEFAHPCCAQPSSSACNRPLWPEAIYNRYNLPFVKRLESLTFQELKAEIDNNRPVEAYIQWSGSGAHVILLTGYYDNEDVDVMDPLTDGIVRKSFQAVKTADGMGQWTMTYQNLGGSVGG